jgi:hypothetical protein
MLKLGRDGEAADATGEAGMAAIMQNKMTDNAGTEIFIIVTSTQRNLDCAILSTVRTLLTNGNRGGGNGETYLSSTAHRLDRTGRRYLRPTAAVRMTGARRGAPPPSAKKAPPKRGFVGLTVNQVST